jgi:hypothetical protein
MRRQHLVLLALRRCRRQARQHQLVDAAVQRCAAARIQRIQDVKQRCSATKWVVRSGSAVAAARAARCAVEQQQRVRPACAQKTAAMVRAACLRRSAARAQRRHAPPLRVTGQRCVLLSPRAHLASPPPRCRAMRASSVNTGGTTNGLGSRPATPCTQLMLACDSAPSRAFAPRRRASTPVTAARCPSRLVSGAWGLTSTTRQPASASKRSAANCVLCCWPTARLLCTDSTRQPPDAPAARTRSQQTGTCCPGCCPPASLAGSMTSSAQGAVIKRCPASMKGCTLSSA